MRYSARRRKPDSKLVSEINVTPLVDVVLVLLIIFMVTAPTLQMGIDINLPRARAKSVDVSEEKLILSINRQQDIYINNYKTSLVNSLVRSLRAFFETRLNEKFSCVPTRMCRMASLFRLWPRSGGRGWISWG